MSVCELTGVIKMRESLSGGWYDRIINMMLLLIPVVKLSSLFPPSTGRSEVGALTLKTLCISSKLKDLRYYLRWIEQNIQVVQRKITPVDFYDASSVFHHCLIV